MGIIEIKDKNEAWHEKWCPRFHQLLEDKLVELPELKCWRITTDQGIFDYYPKANQVHIHKNNVWHKPGLKFLIKKFFNERVNIK